MPAAAKQPRDFEGHDSSHAVAKEGVGSIEQWDDFLADSLDSQRHFSKRGFMQTVAAARQLYRTDIYFLREHLRPVTVNPRRSPTIWETEQAQDGLRIKLVTR